MEFATPLFRNKKLPCNTELHFTPREHSATVEKFVDKLKLSELNIMVQDWGGPIGLGFAGRKPELIHSLIIGNTFVWSADSSKGLRMFSKIFGSRLMRFFITQYNLLDKWLIPAGTNRKLNLNATKIGKLFNKKYTSGQY